MSTLAWIFDDDTVYRWLAYGGTALFIIKLLLTFIGDALGGDGDFDATGAADAADADLDMGDGIDVEHGSDAAFTVVSIQSFLAFGMAMGWMGLACLHEWKLGQGATLLISGGFGFFVMMLNGFLMWQVRRLERGGKVDLKTCVGRIGRVYLTVPAKGEGSGQVEVTASGQRRILRATSKGPEIPSFTEVRVLEMRDNSEVVVQAEAAYQADREAAAKATAESE